MAEGNTLVIPGAFKEQVLLVSLSKIWGIPFSPSSSVPHEEALGLPPSPGIWVFRKDSRKRTRHSITITSPLPDSKSQWSLCTVHGFGL